MAADYQGTQPHMIVWAALLLFPALAFLPGGVATAQKLLHLAMAGVIVVLWLVYRPRSSGGNLLHLAVGYTAVTTIYYVICTLLWSAEITQEDLADLVRPAVYLLYFAVPIVFEVGAADLRKLIRWLRLAVIASVAFSALVYWPAAWPVVDLYKGRPSDDEVVMHFFRWSGTLGYPSDYAFFLSFFIYYSVVDCLRHHRISAGSAIYLFVIFSALVMTLSRGGILTVAFMLALIFMVVGVRWSPRIVVTGGIVGAVLAATIVLSWPAIERASSEHANFAYVGSMFAGRKMDRSTVHRIREGERALQVAAEQFPVGAGPNKERWKEELRVVESLYGHLLLKWGALGLALYLLGVVFVVYACRQVYRVFAADDFVPVFAIATAATIVSVPLIFGFSSAMSDRFKVLGFYYLLAGYACSLWVQARATTTAGGLASTWQTLQQQARGDVNAQRRAENLCSDAGR